MPISNINCLSGKMIIPEVTAPGDRRKYSNSYTKENVRGTLPEPAKPSSIPSNSQWLSGEVAGSWFSLVPANDVFKITRFAPDGTPECTGIFSAKNKNIFDMKKPFSFIHLSHCNKITLAQENEIIELHRIPCS